MLTWRINIFETEDAKEWIHAPKASIFAHWHGDEYSLLHMVKTYSLATMTSTSKDGQIVDMMIRRLGGATSRGSSTRGAVGGLKGLVRLLRSGRTTSIAVDGPRGPYHIVKAGVFELAKLSQAKIFPVGVSVDRAFHFSKSWNKAYLPKPFARIQVQVGPGFPLIEKATDPRSDKLAKDLGLAIDDAGRRASKRFASPDA